MTDKIEWQIAPAMGNGNKRMWLLQSRGTNMVWSTFGYFTSIKAAKTMHAHVRRKPIPLAS